MATDPSPVFLTGATGFVGGYVLRELVRRGHTVHALVRKAGSLKGAGSGVMEFVGSVTEAKTLGPAVAGCAAVIHLVGIIEEKHDTFENVHTEGTRNVLNAAKEAGTVRRFVQMSALGTREGAKSRYHQSKWEAEKLVRGSGLDWKIFRPSLIFGQGGEFTEMLKGWSLGKKAPFLFMPFFGEGFFGQSNSHKIQPVHVEDVAKVFVDALTSEAARGKVYDVAGPKQFTWREMLGIASERFRGKRKAVVGIPAWYAKVVASLPVPVPFNKDQVIMSQEDNTGDIGAMRRDFFTEKELKDFEETLGR